jgi:hypothetical protein
MTYKELKDQLSKLTDEELEQKVLLYDTVYTGKTYNAKELIVAGDEEEEAPFRTLSAIKDLVLITF